MLDEQENVHHRTLCHLSKLLTHFFHSHFQFTFLLSSLTCAPAHTHRDTEKYNLSYQRDF